MSVIHLPRLAPVPVYFVVVFTSATAFMMYGVMSSVYRIIEAGLDPLQLILVGTVLEGSTFLFEVPTGIVADVYSRRWSLIIGAFLIGLGFIVEGLFPIFGVILVAQVLWGTGYSFVSGAEQAWIADEVGEGRIGGIFLRGSQLRQLGSIVGIGAGTFLAAGVFNLPVSNLAVPMIAGGCLSILIGLFMVVFMTEKGFAPVPREERQSWHTLGRNFMDGARTIRRWPALMAIVVIALIFGASSEPLDRFRELHILTIVDFNLPAIGNLNPVVWWGIISASTRLLSIVTLEVVGRLLNIDETGIAARTMFVLTGLMLVSVAIFALSGSFALAVGALLATQSLREVIHPVFDTWTNQHLNSRVRATVFSMRAQADALGQLTVGPAMGVLATFATVRVALLTVAALLLPAQGLLGWLSRRSQDLPVEEART